MAALSANALPYLLFAGIAYALKYQIIISEGATIAFTVRGLSCRGGDDLSHQSSLHPNLG